MNTGGGGSRGLHCHARHLTGHWGVTMKSEPRDIKVRRIQFEYPDDISAQWHPDKPEWSHVVNAASLLMPYLEPFLIDSVREALPHIEDPELAREARAYMGQEANHFRQHRRFNELIIAQGYSALRDYEAQLQADYDRFRKRSLRFKLGYTAGFETMALALGHMLVKHRRFFFQDADPAVSSLVLWHFVEELEHKTSAYYVYQHLFGRSLSGYLYRVYAIFATIAHSMGRSRQAYLQLAKIDGLDKSPRSRWRSRWLMLRIFAWSLPKILHGALPWHRPERVADPAWVRQWAALYDEDAGGVALLDTTRINANPTALKEAST